MEDNNALLVLGAVLKCCWFDSQLEHWDASYTFISTKIYERLAAARVEISSQSEQKILLRFASFAHLLQQTEQKAKIMAEKWRHSLNICNEKVVLSEYNSVSIINMIKTSNVEVICVCFAGCGYSCY